MQWLSGAIVLACVLCCASDLSCDPPCQQGHCVAVYGELSCRCNANWFGEDCSRFACDEDANLCQNGGICVQHPGNTSEYLCSCPEGVFGEHCQYHLHSALCDSQPCGNGGYCYGDGDDYVCLCKEGRYGRNCSFIGEDACTGIRGNCYGNGICSYDESGRRICACTGNFYEIDFDCRVLKPAFNVCADNFHLVSPCENGGQCVATGGGEFFCRCPIEFTGSNCSQPFDVCYGQCQNGGNCSAIEGGHYFECSCPVGYTGQRCEIEVPVACHGNGELVSGVCRCLTGFTGSSCESRDRCSESPCSSHTVAPHCVNLGTVYEPGFLCVCEDGWTGPDCQYQLSSPTIATIDTDATAVSVCDPSCTRLASNDQCEEQCNTILCNFDGLDCIPHQSLPSDPWATCPEAIVCREHFQDRVCNAECNNRECLFDGGDCSQAPEECAQNCTGLAGDGECLGVCYTAQCPFDGQDCVAESTRSFATSRLVLVIVSPPERPFTSPWKEEFLLQLSVFIHSIPVIVEVKVLTQRDLGNIQYLSPERWLIYEVVLRLDISQCGQLCPIDAKDAVVWINAAIASGHPVFGSYVLESAATQADPSGPGEGSSPSSTVFYGIIGSGVVLVGLAVILVAVLLGKRRRVFAKIWRPTSPSEASPSADGVGNSGVTSASTAQSALEAKDYMETSSKKAKMLCSEHVQWEDSICPASSGTEQSSVVIGQRGQDVRKWSMAHTKDVDKLVLQFKQVNGSNLGVNTPGPGGFTPLMLVVMRRPGALSGMTYHQSRSSSESSSDDQTALIPASRGTPRHFPVPPVDSTVSALIEAKANLDAVNDYTQTALHLAAAGSRPEYVDQLVEAGANPNIQDNWGQSALHAAIGAGAEGAFMVLLNCSRTKYNLKSDGGITPLMAAVKMVNGFMVKQLLKKDSEIISSVDDEGRTAVHWAAMVDNIEALRMLVKCGAETIKDAQDNKGQTPLFLACREGSVMCVKHLIDCFANVTLLDNLEQSPMQVAVQKQYVDIVELLRASSHGPLYMRGPNGFSPDVANYTPSGQPTQLSSFPSSKKRKPKSAPSSAANGGHFPKFLPHQVSYPSGTAMPPSSQLQQQSGEAIPMSDLANGTATYHESPPTYPPQTVASQSPPLPPHSFPSTSSHGHYSAATPTTSGYSDATPTTYEDPPPSSGALHNGGSLHVMDSYSLYPATSAGTQPLQHLPVVTEAEVQTLTPDSNNPFVPGLYSPPQSRGSVSHPSPQSAQHASPNSGYGTSPQSLTPSPESQQQTISAVGTVHGTVHVEPYPYAGQHSVYQQRYIGSTPV